MMKLSTVARVGFAMRVSMLTLLGMLFASAESQAAEAIPAFDVEAVQGDSLAEGDRDGNAEDINETPARQTEEEKRKAAESTVRLFGKLFGSMLENTEAEDSEDEAFLHLIGQPAPDLKLETITGDKLHLKDLRGQVVVLDFWASWCGPCVAALPEIEQVHTHFADADVTVIGVNQQEEIEVVKTFLARQGTTFTQVLDNESEVGDLFAVSTIPQTVVIDKEGIIQEIHTGFASDLRQKMIASIEKLLQGENLYDEQRVADARREREVAQAKLIEQIGLYKPERLERLEEVLSDDEVEMRNYYNPPQWITLPGEAQPALVIATGIHRLAVIRPGRPAEAIDVDWSDDVGIWDFAPVDIDGETRWALLGGEYDDEYDVKQFTIALVGLDGKPEWTQIYPLLDADSYPTVDLTAGDFTGDGTSEIALLVAHDGLGDAIRLGADCHSRVLTIYDSKGEKVLRSCVPGQRDAALLVMPGDECAKLLIATDKGLTQFGVKP